MAGGADQLFAAATRDRFGLPTSSAVATAVDALTSRPILFRFRDGDTITSDSPVFRRWVAREALQHAPARLTAESGVRSQDCTMHGTMHECMGMRHTAHRRRGRRRAPGREGRGPTSYILHSCIVHSCTLALLQLHPVLCIAAATPLMLRNSSSRSDSFSASSLSAR